MNMLCMTEREFLGIRRYMADHGVEPVDYGKERCCFLGADGRCMIREARPQACRFYSSLAVRQGTGEPAEDLWMVDMHEAFMNDAMDDEAALWRSWSSDGQTPAYLAVTRMASLSGRNIGLILDRLGLEPGMRVLDVGCGSGEYCFRLGSQVEGVSFTGLDHDADFVRFAQRRAEGGVGYPYEQPNPANDYRFVCADGLRMPFDSGSFDAVVSHTYLTALPSWQQGLKEMLRVCKPGGTVSSITSMTDDFYGSGLFRLFGEAPAPEDAELVARVDEVCARAFPEVNLISGAAPRDVPSAFARAGLDEVSCLPLGHYFCLSDAALGGGDYRRYVDLLRLVERERLARLLANPVARSQLSERDWRLFGELVERRHAELLTLEGANDEWNWYGNASLLVSGRVPETTRFRAWTGTDAPFMPPAPRGPRPRR